MSDRLQQAYQTLELKPGSSLDQIKKRHRELIKQWHPDTFQEESDKQKAHTETAKINAAYSYLKSIKQRKSTVRKATKSDSFKSQSSNDISRSKIADREKNTGQKRANKKPNYDTSAQNKTRPENRKTYQPSRFNTFFSDLNNRMSYRSLKRSRDIHSKAWKKMMEKEQVYWQKLYQKYNERTRVGLYRSLINALVFGRIIRFEPSTHLPGVFSVREKYEIDLCHQLINDQIFYAINKGYNIILKYLFGILIIAELTLTTLLYYSYGYIPNFRIYFGIQMELILMASILLVPDNVLQRGMLWKYRNLQGFEIQSTFKNKKLPENWEAKSQFIFVLKYFILFWMQWHFVKKIFLH